MPSINLQIQKSAGPLIQVFIGVSMPRADALKSAGLPVPATVSGTFLIDTGASCTCIDPTLINKLGIPASGSCPISTPSTQGTPHHCNLYDVLMFIPNGDAGGHLIEAIPVVETSLASQGIEGLIGRDVLDTCLLVYNGSTGHYSLSY